MRRCALDFGPCALNFDPMLEHTLNPDLQAGLALVEQIYAEFRVRTPAGRQQLMVELLALDRQLAERCASQDLFPAHDQARAAWNTFIGHCLAQTGKQDPLADAFAREQLDALRVQLCERDFRCARP